MTDMPERFQLRGIPVCPSEEGELQKEAEWIYRYAFDSPPILKQEHHKKCLGAVEKIRLALDLMRKERFDVPFIAIYHKEVVQPELDITDLWKVYNWDEKWMQLRNHKQNLVRLFEHVQQFQLVYLVPETTFDSHYQILCEKDINRAKNIQTTDELCDVHKYFLLYFRNDLQKMKSSWKPKKVKQREHNEHDIADTAPQDESGEEPETLKSATRKSGIEEAGLVNRAKGIEPSAQGFGGNFGDNHQKHEAMHYLADLQGVGELICNDYELIRYHITSCDEILKDEAVTASDQTAAMQIAYDPAIKSSVRR